jgi:hypothetical protein
MNGGDSFRSGCLSSVRIELNASQLCAGVFGDFGQRRAVTYAWVNGCIRR